MQGSVRKKVITGITLSKLLVSMVKEIELSELVVKLKVKHWKP